MARDTWGEDEQLRARRALEERLREEETRLRECRCRSPTQDRVYFGRWSCRRCGRLMGG